LHCALHTVKSMIRLQDKYCHSSCLHSCWQACLKGGATSAFLHHKLTATCCTHIRCTFYETPGTPPTSDQLQHHLLTRQRTIDVGHTTPVDIATPLTADNTPGTARQQQSSLHANMALLHSRCTQRQVTVTLDHPHSAGMDAMQITSILPIPDTRNTHECE
jgi:hypothetical protein